MAKPSSKKPAPPAEIFRQPLDPAERGEGGRRGASTEPDWKDSKDDPPPPMKIPRAEAVARLVDAGEATERAVQYVDLFAEYREATLNIRKYGVVVMNAHVRQPMENPYMGRRDKARDALAKFRDIEAPWLWQELAE